LIGRIHERTIFRRLRREGVSVRVGPLWCSVLLDPSVSVPHVAYALGRATGPAVVRNRLRRQLRNIVRSNDAALPGGWFLIGADARATSMTFAELSLLTADLLHRGVDKATAKGRK
jgi:ribonuclease P protein component